MSSNFHSYINQRLNTRGRSRPFDPILQSDQKFLDFFEKFVPFVENLFNITEDNQNDVKKQIQDIAQYPHFDLIFTKVLDLFFFTRIRFLHLYQEIYPIAPQYFQNNTDISYYKLPSNSVFIDYFINDDIDNFITLTNINSDIDLEKESVSFGYYFQIQLVDLAAFFSATKIYKYLHMNSISGTEDLPAYAFAGGNYEIVRILIQDNAHISKECLFSTIAYHRYELYDFLILNYNFDDYLRYWIDGDRLRACFFYSDGCKSVIRAYFSDIVTRNFYKTFQYATNLYPEIIHFIVNKSTPLFHAIKNGFIDIIKVIIQHTKKEDDKNDALIYSTKINNKELFNLAIQSYGDSKINKDAALQSLLIGVENFSLDVVNYFLDNNVINVDKNILLSTIFDSTLKKGTYQMFEYLIEKQNYIIDINRTDNDGNNALHLASMNNSTSIVDYLIKNAHIDPLKTNLYNQTPLHIAAFYGNIDLVKYFIQHIHIDPKLVDIFYETPLDLAMQNNHTETIKYLRKYY